MKTLAIYSIKGGVGKTATAVNLAYLSAKQGFRTLLWDLDPQAAATWYFRARPRIKGFGKRMFRRRTGLAQAVRGSDYYGLDIVPADFSYRKLGLRIAGSKKPANAIARRLRRVEEEYDVVLLDCAPSLSTVSESVFEAADALLVPTIPTPLSGRTLAQLRAYLGKRKASPELMPMLSMVDRRKRLHRELCEQAEDDRQFLVAKIPYSSLVEQMGVHRAPLFEYAGRSLPALAYLAVWREVAERLEL